MVRRHLLLAAATLVRAGMGPDCEPLDRHCTLPAPQHEPCVWVGPHDGKWLRIVDKETLDPAAPRPAAPVGSSEDHDASIVFAAIASFRDSICPHTLANMFLRARFPDRIRVAVIQQNEVGDVDCLEKYCEDARTKQGLAADAPCPRRGQISVKRFSADEAKGPTWARAQDTDMLPSTAEFCLRTDSHMTFAKDWDTLQIKQWYDARNEYAVLSTYVADSTQLKDDGSMINVNGVWEVPHLCSIQWENGHVRNMQAKAARLLKKPKLTTLWAAGLSFSRCHAERTVPYDPHTPYIFWGEEFSRTARFFTHGYDIYTPPKTLIAHDYKHTQGDPTHFKWNGRGGPRLNRNQTILKQREAANKRIWTLLGMPGGDSSPSARQALGKYGLGTKRTLDQLKAFTGINLHNRTTTGNRCGNIDWVPWDYSDRGWASDALEHLHNSISPPESIADDLAREIYRGEQFVEKEAHLVAHEADIAEAFIAREAHLLAHEAQFVGSELRDLERKAAQHLPLPEDEGVSVLTALVGLFCLWTSYKACRAVFDRGNKANQKALGLPVAKEV
jgi:hypothetical protein